MPSPGRITFLAVPGGPGVRIDSAAYNGWVVPPNYDSLIAKLIVKADTRDEAIARMKRALDEFKIEGIKTTIPFHQKIFSNPVFLSGIFNTDFIEKMNQAKTSNGNGKAVVPDEKS
jgi:acetyl-CoA carboxylase biotin carboxylase subunit